MVQYKAQARLEEKRKKALDLHLNFIVDQTEKYSTWLTEGLKKEGGSLGSGSNVVTPSHSDVGDDEFKPLKDDVSDDEETIEREEAELDQVILNQVIKIFMFLHCLGMTEIIMSLIEQFTLNISCSLIPKQNWMLCKRRVNFPLKSF